MYFAVMYFKIKFRLLLQCLFLATSFLANGQAYQLAQLPDSMKNGAHAIVWLDETTVKVGNDLKASLVSHTVITILNEKGNHFALYTGYYNEFVHLQEVTGNMFDAAGKKIASFKKRDLEDVPEEDGFSLVTSTRFKFKDLSQRTYPYTIEFFEESSLEGYINLPGFKPIPENGVALLKGDYQIETSGFCNVRYQALNGMPQPERIPGNSGAVLKWTIKNIPPVLNTVSFNETYFPKLLVTTDQFTYGGYKGRSETWKELGSYFWNLNKGRDQLPENLAKEIHARFDSITNVKARAIALYKWMQSHTRYINVALGIGGMQPFEATQVAEKKYGDCKGLNNYMCSILKEANIESYYCLVAAGSDKRNAVVEGFPYDYFNHIITLVPNNGDTLWLECTSQTNPAGFLGSFTGDRVALVLKESGGVLVPTQRYTHRNNRQLRSVEATIQEDGSMIVESNTVFEGLKQEFPLAMLHQKNEKERFEYLNSNLNFPTYEVQVAHYKKIGNESVNEHLRIKTSGYVTVSGKRIFIVSNLFNRLARPSLPDSLVKELLLETGGYEKDSVVIHLPEEYMVESLPSAIKLPSVFGNYSIRFLFEPGRLTMVRELETIEGTYPREIFQVFKKRMETIFKSDQLKTVLIKKT